MAVQTMMFAGRKYCLSRLGFGLKVALQIIKAGCVVSRRDCKRRDVSVHEEVIMSSLQVRVKLIQFVIICKNPEQLEYGARVLGSDV